MSYCRFFDGDVYMFSNGENIVCMCCSMTEKETKEGLFGKITMNRDCILDTKKEALGHLQEHRKKKTECLKEQLIV